jgi:hypothetical protein
VETGEIKKGASDKMQPWHGGVVQRKEGFGRFTEQLAHAQGGTIKGELSRCSSDHEIESEQTRSEPFTNLDGCHSLQLYEKASKIPQCPRFGLPGINTLATTLSYFLFFSFLQPTYVD